ncbi:alcohol dehydrogenase catalytic domain-containing protein [Aeromicrobium fastidiosum]|uniref:alcohol dehydrogenase catalytic domain-containing protein n=1 Tax=Aeromicrobium TaxID=2040 RepID=UPI00177FDBE0|nr:alcohol dehydrogenase catalytic domain-containing protein [Aeromicrobium fastidiosum]MBD8607304.1 alcohol dehydrogenase catalytic domain-containing protein [Aeromicrobium sp. CFBP 8757]MCL8251952.1 alcohol dehydrogenase catalytic domain-containing protein [Aeromicrobium fastidiosum]
MRALTWQGKRNVSVETVPDPKIVEPDDIIIQVTTSGLCGSDLHLYDPLGPFLHPGDILGHEPMGRVVERGSAVTDLAIGDRVVIPFQIACGSCFMCSRGLQTQCEVTQVREYGMGAALFGYTDLYGAVPGGQAELLRVPHGNYGPIKIESDYSDERFVYLSDVAPTAYQGVEYSGVSAGDTLLVVGLGPIGEMAARIAMLRGVRVIGVDLVPERLARSASLGVETIDLLAGDAVAAVQELTGGRGADAALEAVGMEAHGSGVAEAAQKVVGLLPKALSRPLMTNASTDRLAALDLAFQAVRRGGTVSISGVYAGAADPFSMQLIFDKQLSLRMGQANVKNWIDDLLPLAEDSSDPLGLESFATHHLTLEEAPAAYEMFQKKQDGAIKVLFKP